MLSFEFVIASKDPLIPACLLSLSEVNRPE